MAKLFMSDLGPSKATIVDASSTDCTGLTNLMFWCVYFRVQVHLVEAVREMRNTKWGHAARQELTDREKVDALTDIRNLLQDPELDADNDAKSALSEINLMEKHFDAQSVERKVLAEFQVTVYGRLDSIGDKIKDLKRNCVSRKKSESVSRKVQKKLSSLESKQTKMFKLLQSIDDRMEDERNRNIPYATQVSDLAKRVFLASEHKIVSNLRSLNTRSLAVWMVVIMFMGCFRCLNHNSYNDGKLKGGFSTTICGKKPKYVFIYPLFGNCIGYHPGPSWQARGGSREILIASQVDFHGTPAPTNLKFHYIGNMPTVI